MERAACGRTVRQARAAKGSEAPVGRVEEVVQSGGRIRKRKRQKENAARA